MRILNFIFFKIHIFSAKKITILCNSEKIYGGPKLSYFWLYEKRLKVNLV